MRGALKRRVRRFLPQKSRVLHRMHVLIGEKDGVRRPLAMGYSRYSLVLFARSNNLRGSAVEKEYPLYLIKYMHANGVVVLT